jgi:hypothetical protein
LRAGGGVGRDNLDVHGARTVHLLFGVGNPDPAISWRLIFGSATSPVATTNSGNFGDDNIVAIAVPVFGPTLSLLVESQSTQNETVFATIYFIRE